MVCSKSSLGPYSQRYHRKSPWSLKLNSRHSIQNRKAWYFLQYLREGFPAILKRINTFWIVMKINIWLLSGHDGWCFSYGDSPFPNMFRRNRQKPLFQEAFYVSKHNGKVIHALHILRPNIHFQCFRSNGRVYKYEDDQASSESWFLVSGQTTFYIQISTSLRQFSKRNIFQLLFL